jgi:hypothetical protein
VVCRRLAADDSRIKVAEMPINVRLFHCSTAAGRQAAGLPAAVERLLELHAVKYEA